jgi:subtilisin
LYKDMSGHVHNVRPTNSSNPVILDTTAYLEGYRSTFGYGLVNAARAVAYALGTQTVVTGAPLENWNLDLVKAPDAWSSATGVNAAVFVLDSGVDIDNLDLNTLAGRNVAAQTTNVTDSTGHGTGVAGIIAAKNDAGGITGVAFDAKVVPIKVGDASPNSETTLVNGIDYAMNYTLPGGYATATRVLNLSLATTQSTNPGNILAALRNKMYSESADAVFVLAAGNRTQNRPDYPAGFAVGFGIVAGAINIDGKRWAPTNAANSLAPMNYLLAPGVDVPTDTLVGDSGDNHNTTNVSGTSVAAAHISGVIALMLDANPALTPREVESILIASADQVITQTVAASAPSIPATIYFAGEADSGQMAALTTDRISLAVGGESTPDTNEIPTSPPSKQATATIVASPTTKAVDEVFEAVSQEEAEDLLDLFAADDSFTADQIL